MNYALTVNGQSRTVDVEGDTPLLWVLRDDLDLKGSKFGCGMGLCGACTIHINGKATRSCITPVSAAGTRAITTIEGIGNICRCATYARIRAAIKDAAGLPTADTREI